MAYKVIVTDDAHEDMDEAVSYIALSLANPSAASSLLAEIEACFEQLRAFPFYYPSCGSFRLKERGYRKASIKNYILIYRPVEEEELVYVLRFLYGGRNYDALL